MLYDGSKSICQITTEEMPYGLMEGIKTPDQEKIIIHPPDLEQIKKEDKENAGCTAMEATTGTETMPSKMYSSEWTIPRISHPYCNRLYEDLLFYFLPHR